MINERWNNGTLRSGFAITLARHELFKMKPFVAFATLISTDFTMKTKHIFLTIIKIYDKTI